MRLVRSILMQDPVWCLYALGDLAAPFASDCQWFVSPDGVSSLVLVYRGFELPILFSTGEPQPVDIILNELGGPRRFYLHLRPGTFDVVRRRSRECAQKPMWRMIVEAENFKPCLNSEARRLSARDFPAVQRLYSYGTAAGETPGFFSHVMLRDGVYYGIFQGEELVAAAGTHLFVPEEGVAAIGNIFTRPDSRRLGLATRVTSAVAAELLNRVRLVGLNVHQTNLGAIRVYERLGFVRYCGYFEGEAEIAFAG
jgi:ribosomal protein S18 acetylase RimI-like enzyme